MQGEASGDPRLLSRGLVFGVVGLDERGGSLIVPSSGVRESPRWQTRAVGPCLVLLPDGLGVLSSSGVEN